MKYTKYLPSGLTHKASRTPTHDHLSKGFGEEALMVEKEFTNAADHYVEPITRIQILKKFDILAETWKYNNTFVSSVPDMVLQKTYQEIIGMGPQILPLIFEELKNRPNFWFWALSSITGENPVKLEDRGRIEKMRDAWLNWGVEHGYV